MRPAGATLVTHGRVLAAGPTALLVYECDDAARCRTLVIDRRTGARRPEPTVDPHAAQMAFASQGGVALIDLRTGRPRGSFPLGSYTVGPDASALFTCSPDSRYLLIARPIDGLLVVDTTTNAAFPLRAIPTMIAIAVLPAPAR